MSDLHTRTVTQAAPVQGGDVLCEVLSGRGVAARHALSPELQAIAGSDPSVDLVLKDPTVSRRHASFDVTPRGVHVKDLGSRNGTWYLGANVGEALVPLGATVRLGKTLVRFTQKAEGIDAPAFEGLRGSSPAMREHRAALQRVAPTDVSVLLRGETGSGKEAAARALHAAGTRAANEFVVFDHGHTGSELLESHLFGHRRGAFTGATDHRTGAVELAHKGTLFLDEIGELTPEAQLRLLRVIETGRFTRLGDSAVRESDFRVISATQHDLERLVFEKKFREELYFRLAVVVIDVPPLRQRSGDITLLAEHFAAERGISLDGVTLSAWQRREWPGNIRELQNAVQRYDVTAPASELEAAPPVPRQQVMDDVEKNLLLKSLEHHQYDVNAAAKQLGLSRSQLYRLMQRHGVAPKRRGMAK